MTGDKAQLYDERFNRYVTALRNGKPDKVPIRPFAAEFTATALTFFLSEPYALTPSGVRAEDSALTEVLRQAKAYDRSEPPAGVEENPDVGDKVDSANGPVCSR
ncbi:MAG: hypothetical protein HZB26_26680 [Candidatus Hydrogenedentes bacterium]|nr:hypothetical protein [Candidatus Hydrogenedentota bacterium]